MTLSKEKKILASYERFRNLLEDRDVRANKVSKATGIASATLSDWKAGRYQPKINKLMLIAKFFDVPIEYFLTDEEQT